MTILDNQGAEARTSVMLRCATLGVSILACVFEPLAGRNLFAFLSMSLGISLYHFLWSIKQFSDLYTKFMVFVRLCFAANCIKRVRKTKQKPANKLTTKLGHILGFITCYRTYSQSESRTISIHLISPPHILDLCSIARDKNRYTMLFHGIVNKPVAPISDPLLIAGFHIE